MAYEVDYDSPKRWQWFDVLPPYLEIHSFPQFIQNAFSLNWVPEPEYNNWYAWAFYSATQISILFMNATLHWFLCGNSSTGIILVSQAYLLFLLFCTTKILIAIFQLRAAVKKMSKRSKSNWTWDAICFAVCWSEVHWWLWIGLSRHLSLKMKYIDNSTIKSKMLYILFLKIKFELVKFGNQMICNQLITLWKRSANSA